MLNGRNCIYAPPGNCVTYESNVGAAGWTNATAATIVAVVNTPANIGHGFVFCRAGPVYATSRMNMYILNDSTGNVGFGTATTPAVNSTYNTQDGKLTAAFPRLGSSAIVSFLGAQGTIGNANLVWVNGSLQRSNLVTVAPATNPYVTMNAGIELFKPSEFSANGTGATLCELMIFQGSVANASLRAVERHLAQKWLVPPPIPVSGTVSIAQIATQLGVAGPPFAMSSMYDDNAFYEPTTSNIVPTSGNVIQASHFYGKTGVVPPLSSLAYSANTRASFAMTRVSAEYTGPILQLVRFSDSAVANVYADVNGVQGMAFNGRGTSLASWMGTGNASVRTWYDQSGSGRHATQTVAASMPWISNASVSNLIAFATSTQFFNLPDSTVPIGDSNYTFTAKHGNTALDGVILGSGDPIATGSMNGMQVTPGYYHSSDWFGTVEYGNIKPAHIDRVALRYDRGVLRTMYTGNVLSCVSTLSVHKGNGASNFIGKSGYYGYTGAPLKGNLYYLHIFGSALSERDRVAMNPP